MLKKFCYVAFGKEFDFENLRVQRAKMVYSPSVFYTILTNL